MKRILFVDDEQRVLSGLRRQLHARRAEWEMSFVDGGEAALAALDQAAASGAPVDVIVSDMRMPGMDGAQLLSRVAREHPRLGRLVLSGHADPDRVQLARSCAHRYLNKPCPPEALETEIRRALAVRGTLDRLAWASADEIWRTPPSLFPACADVFVSLAGERTADALSADLARLFVGDGALWTQLAPLVAAARPAQAAGPASASPATASSATTLAPDAAVAALGARPLMALAMGRRFFDAFVGQRPGSEKRWLGVTTLATTLGVVAAGERLGSEVVLSALTAALLLLPDQPIHSGDAACDDGCREILDYLLPTWGFPDPVVATAAWHRSPGRCPAPLSVPLAALLAAELLVSWREPGLASGAEREAEIVAWLQQRGWTGLRERWPAAGAPSLQSGSRVGR